MDHGEFVANQDKIYRKFRDSPVRTEGIKPNPAIETGQAGYIVALRPRVDVLERLGEVSDSLQKVTPGLVYGPNNAHTTILTYGLEEGMDFEPDEAIIEKLVRGVRQSQSSLKRTAIVFEEWFTNQNTVIATGRPDSYFVDNAERIVEAVRGEGLEVKMPWGSHITAFRPTSARPPEELEDFFKLVDEAPNLSLCVSGTVDVGYFQMSPKGFNLETFERIEIEDK